MTSGAAFRRMTAARKRSCEKTARCGPAISSMSSEATQYTKKRFATDQKYAPTLRPNSSSFTCDFATTSPRK